MLKLSKDLNDEKEKFSAHLFLHIYHLLPRVFARLPSLGRPNFRMLHFMVDAVVHQLALYFLFL